MGRTGIAIGAITAPRRAVVAAAILVAGAIALPLPAGAQPSAYVFSLPPGIGPPGGAANVSLLLDSSAGSAAHGFSAAVCSNPQFVVPISAELGSAIATMQGGQPPDFVELEFYPTGFTAGVIFDFIAQYPLPAGAGHELLRISYTLSPVAPIGGTTPLAFCTTGSPPVSTTVVVSGMTITSPTLIDGEMAFAPTPDYLRGDANQDGVLSITDAVVILEILFFGRPPGFCPRTADANADGVRNIADAIALLNALILPSAPLPPPFPSCGPDPFTSPIICLPYPACP